MYRAFADAKLPGGEVVYLTLDIHPQTLPKVTSPLGSPAFSVWVRVPSGAPKKEPAFDFSQKQVPLAHCQELG